MAIKKLLQGADFGVGGAGFVGVLQDLDDEPAGELLKYSGRKSS